MIYQLRLLFKGSTGNILESSAHYRERRYSNPNYQVISADANPNYQVISTESSSPNYQVISAESSTYKPTVFEGNYEVQQDGETGLGWRVVRGSTEAGTVFLKSFGIMALS